MAKTWNTIRSYENERIEIKIGDKVLIYLGLGEFKFDTIKGFLGQSDERSCLQVEMESGTSIPENCIVRIITKQSGKEKIK